MSPILLVLVSAEQVLQCKIVHTKTPGCEQYLMTETLLFPQGNAYRLLSPDYKAERLDSPA